MKSGSLSNDPTDNISQTDKTLRQLIHRSQRTAKHHYMRFIDTISCEAERMDQFVHKNAVLLETTTSTLAITIRAPASFLFSQKTINSRRKQQLVIYCCEASKGTDTRLIFEELNRPGTRNVNSFPKPVERKEIKSISPLIAQVTASWGSVELNWLKDCRGFFRGFPKFLSNFFWDEMVQDFSSSTRLMEWSWEFIMSLGHIFKTWLSAGNTWKWKVRNFSGLCISIFTQSFPLISNYVEIAHLVLQLWLSRHNL